MNVGHALKRGGQSALCLAVLVTLSTSAAAQGITGAAVDEAGNPLRSILVTFRDALNAELISTATTDYSGAYSSGLIPPGNYRVRFSDPLGTNKGGFYGPQFFGAGGFDTFCSGTIVGVVPAADVAGVNAVMKASSPTLVVPASGVLNGVVVDATSGVSLNGIKVSFLDAGSSETIVELATGAGGDYRWTFQDVFPYSLRVRFSDPASTYFPQFSGANGLDDFCAATTVALSERTKLEIDASLRPIPGELTEQLVGQIEGLNLPESVTTALAAPLVKATDLLRDGNPSNDAAACGQLTAFTARVAMQAKKGQLSPAEATALRQSADAVRAALGCP